MEIIPCLAYISDVIVTIYKGQVTIFFCVGGRFSRSLLVVRRAILDHLPTFDMHFLCLSSLGRSTFFLNVGQLTIENWPRVDWSLGRRFWQIGWCTNNRLYTDYVNISGGQARNFFLSIKIEAMPTKLQANIQQLRTCLIIVRTLA